MTAAQLALPPVGRAVMPCAGCRRMLDLPGMVWLAHGRVGCRDCREAGR